MHDHSVMKTDTFRLFKANAHPFDAILSNTGLQVCELQETLSL